MSRHSRTTRFVALLLASLSYLGTVHASTKDALRETWPGPREDLVSIVLAAPPAENPGKLPASHPAAFVPVADTVDLTPLLKALRRDEAEREQLRILFGMIPGMIRTQFEPRGQDNLAMVLALFVAVSVQASNGVPLPPDPPADALYKSLVVAIADSNAYAALSDRTKSHMNDWLACMAMFLTTQYDEALKAKDERRLRELATIARDAMRIVLDTDVTTLAFDDEGLVRKERGALNDALRARLNRARVALTSAGLPPRTPRDLSRFLPALLVLLLAGCATPPPRSGRPPEEVRAQLVQLLPASVHDREGWAADIQVAFEALDVPPSTENLCAALAVTEQESTFVADPVVPGLAKIAQAEIENRAAKLKVPKFAVRAALKLTSPDGEKSYAQRLATVRTEQQLSELYEDFIGMGALGQRLFEGANPVRTGGPMQVRIDFAERHAKQRRYPYRSEDSIRHEVFSRRGGMYFGIAHLLDYPNSYDRHIYRFADFNAGWYASRNAAFQAAVSAATGTSLVLDGDLVLRGKRVGATEAAVRTLAAQLELDDRQIRNALDSGRTFEFERSELYRRVFELAQRRSGRALPRAVIPRITLHSPKITRKLTTAWFADRVQQRYQRCVNRAFSG